MNKDNCPQPDYPLRERAYAKGQMQPDGTCPHCGHKPPKPIVTPTNELHVEGGFVRGRYALADKLVDEPKPGG